jgi:cystathionine beta-lyase/cystathionine gamma-synthase
LVASSVFRLRDLDHLDRIRAGEECGFVYARDGHPNATALARKLAEREHAEAGLIVSSGMAALATVMVGLFKQGDHILASSGLYGKTTHLLVDCLSRFGVSVRLIPESDHAGWTDALETHPAGVLVESLSNPMLRATHLPWLAERCRHVGSTLIVDATFTPPPMLRALDLGADLVMHSLTKFISGHGDVTLGFLAGNHERISKLAAHASTWGFHASAFDCWLTQRGLETLDIRWQAACENARHMGNLLRTIKAVSHVVDPGHRNHPDHRWLSEHANSFGNMLSFELADGRNAVNRFFGQLQHIGFYPSLGDVQTTVSYPWLTSHVALSESERRSLGVTPGLVRMSVGIEPWTILERDIIGALS